jgi:hypothetical protein
LLIITISILPARPISGVQNTRNLILNFDAIQVHNTHDTVGTARWLLDVYVNEKKISLSDGTGLADIPQDRLIPLGRSIAINTAENGTLRIVTAGYDEDFEHITLPDISPELRELGSPISINVGGNSGVAIKAGIGDFLAGAYDLSQKIIKYDKNDAIGVIAKAYSTENNFGVGRHIDCSNANHLARDLSEVQNTDCDFILRYTVRDVSQHPLIPSWHDWKNIAGMSIISNPSVISNGPGKMDIVVLGTDNVLWDKHYDYDWDGWAQLSTSSLVPGDFVPANTSIALASWGPERLDVFTNGVDGKLWSNWFDHYTGKWHTWQPFDNQFNSSATAFSLGPNKLNVLALGMDNSLCINSYNPQQGGWGNWVSSSGSTCLRTSSVPNLSGLFSLFSTIKSQTCQNSILECTVINTVPQNLAYAPVLISSIQGRLDLFVLLKDSKIWHEWYKYHDGGWLQQGSEKMTQYTFTSNPSIISLSPSSINIDMYGQLTNGSLFHNTYNGKTWQHWSNFGRITSPPSVIYWDNPKRIDIFARNDTTLIHKWWGTGDIFQNEIS